MLKGEAEQMIRRSCEDSGKQMTEEEISFLAEVILKICSRMLEEALASWSQNKPGSRPNFFA